MLSYPAGRRVSRDERGVSLIETIVAMVSGLVLLGAMFSILEVSLHQSTRLTDVAQATQLGRNTMTRVVDELHSACISPGFTPIQEGSNSKEMTVISAYSENATIGAESVRKDKIVWSEAAKTLTDTRYQGNGGEWPKYTFPEKATAVTRVGESVTQAENEKKEKLPIFRYYAYAAKAGTGTSAPSSALNEAEPLTGEGEKGLSAKEAKTAASVLVSFRTAPPSGSTQASRSIDLSSQVTFAFSAPSSEASIKDGPCE
jgi:hypothetical protein